MVLQSDRAPLCGTLTQVSSHHPLLYKAPAPGGNAYNQLSLDSNWNGPRDDVAHRSGFPVSHVDLQRDPATLTNILSCLTYISQVLLYNKYIS